ncbi:MAG: DUF58 domain-containing protein [Oscillospiraceae bacterium]
MRKRIKLGNASNMMVSNFAILFFFALGITCTVYNLPLVSGMFFFLFLLGVIARIWGGFAMKRLSASATCTRTRLFPGESTEIEYIIRNDKALPLIWLEVSQKAPPKDCLVPDENFEYFDKEYNSKHGVAYESNVRQKFSFIMGHEAVTFPSTWTAKCRGLYQMESIILRSGDGFGLTQAEQINEVMNIPDFAVYPRPVPVNITTLLMDQRDSQIGSKGYIEDPTILRGIRNYQTSDSWKRINWRALARQSELKVNMYEIIRPKAVHFIVDGESFARITNDNKYLEVMLEIIASSITRLFEAGVQCGLSIPKSMNFPAINLPPDETRTLEEILYYFAGYECLNALDEEVSTREHKVWLPAQFELQGAISAAFMAGKTYYVTFRTPKELPVMLGSIDPSRAAIFTVMDTNVNPPYDVSVSSLSVLKSGAADTERRGA